MFGLGKKRCPYCHEYIRHSTYVAHLSAHTRRRSDGQQEEHITQPPESRYEGSLDGVPQTYHHPKCDGSTGMPEEIIRSYLVNPFLYNERTFCTGCGDYVHQSELWWHETGENLHQYFERLKQQYQSGHEHPPRG